MEYAIFNQFFLDYLSICRIEKSVAFPAGSGLGLVLTRKLNQLTMNH